MPFPSLVRKRRAIDLSQPYKYVAYFSVFVFLAIWKYLQHSLLHEIMLTVSYYGLKMRIVHHSGSSLHICRPRLHCGWTVATDLGTEILMQVLQRGHSKSYS